MSHDRVRVSRALLSVSDKTGLVDFARGLAAHGIDLVSTGGTRRALRAAGLAVTEVAALTGFPEMMDGRVKTLHPAVHGGLLAVRGNPEHQAALAAHGIGAIDLLVVNLYPFEDTLAKGGSYDECVETIDVGGPAMIRAAAKNHADVAVVTEVADYARVLTELEKNDGTLGGATRRRLAQKAFARTAAYDSAIANWLDDEVEGQEDGLPTYRTFGGRLVQTLRYGENPHQWAAFYRQPGAPVPGIASARQVQGKELSYNNLSDTDAAYGCVAEFDPARTSAVVIVKHANPCGVAEGASLLDAYEKALACDPTSAFGGIVALNRTLDAEAARKIVEIFTEVIIAPDATEEAVAIVGAKKNLRLLLAGGLPPLNGHATSVRSVAGGLLVQAADTVSVDDMTLTVVTKRAPSEAEVADLRFAYRVAKHVKSNAIVYARGGATVGIGAGQMSRVDSSRIAAWKAGEGAQRLGLAESLAKGAVVASDAFFPFADGLMAAAEAGATAVIQPGGSMRDDDVIAAADAAGLAMVFTGVRHFRH
ncbi:bifunctional phosphoribosylaminoimidazolecarboxamide formyltransferase/IMP cyclohydrolase [uncultured Methylobacterium sp.]|uniref:bifunctional phosphoribosylaminoimidazolecarboxamide formyltransferase/IMP cyclohydrolase n=1 Tax=uncultured Methylobacterium sp. TaxID=157278 RepID=UPI0035CC2BB5